MSREEIEDSWKTHASFILEIEQLIDKFINNWHIQALNKTKEFGQEHFSNSSLALVFNEVGIDEFQSIIESILEELSNVLAPVTVHNQKVLLSEIGITILRYQFVAMNITKTEELKQILSPRIDVTALQGKSTKSGELFWGGAVTGMFAGSFIPVVGSLVGGAIGGVVSLMGGSGINKKRILDLAKLIASEAVEQAHLGIKERRFDAIQLITDCCLPKDSLTK